MELADCFVNYLPLRRNSSHFTGTFLRLWLLFLVATSRGDGPSFRSVRREVQLVLRLHLHLLYSSESIFGLVVLRFQHCLPLIRHNSGVSRLFVVLKVFGRLAEEILAGRLRPAVLVGLEERAKAESANVVVKIVEINLTTVHRFPNFLAI